MARDEAYYEAEEKIEETRLSGGTKLNLCLRGLTDLPESLGQLTQLQSLDFGGNLLTVFPDSIIQLKQLRNLGLGTTQMDSLKKPVQKRMLRRQKQEDQKNNELRIIPESIGTLTELRFLDFSFNQLTDLPLSLNQLIHLTKLDLDYNPLNPELAEAYKQGLDAVKVYLRAKAEAQIILNEAKLILVGEGEVGKTCLMDALLGNEWQEHPSTHGIEIKPIKVTNPDAKTEIILNGWDFGGQRVYRPTHQLFFSAPAVYLVVWKPREGPQQGFVKEWIKLVKHREPDAKILVVATHGGPQQRQPDIDRQELWDLFGRETIADFIKVFTDEAKEGPRLFSLFPIERSKFNPKNWIREKFRLVLWCEHSRLPLPALNGIDSKKGVYDLELDREWFTKAVPYLKLLTGTLSLVLPVASSALKVIDDAAFKILENQLGLGKEVLDAVSGAGTAINEFMDAVDTTELKQGVSVRGDGAILREFHALLKAKDPSNNFGGLVRVINNRQEFMWVHERFAGEY